ncbi:unnamed protein product [Bemisia tabaci]|uniref:N-acetyltransferase domain-containing protein n=1 Tax=Bemisia tabaci TaxID=7038 RepID=A0A9P0C453_BEMTA|nr:PREDICTED: uncharacterized protein LOC109040336 [Bemisia tabaci]CAH0753015.1 unnamed protein product [Bemisia tabaci]
MDEEKDGLLGESRDGTIVYKRLPTAGPTLDTAIRVLNEAFYPEEPLCRALQVTQSPQAICDLDALFLGMAQDYLSVVALDAMSHKVVGVCFNKLETKPMEGNLDFYEVFKKRKCKEDRIKFFIDVLAEETAGIDLFEKYKTDAVVDLVCLTVLPDFKRRGIGKSLMEHSLELARRTNAASAACVVCSSTYTLKMAKSIGFTELTSVPYSQYIYEGRQFSDVIRDHASVVLVAKKLQ